MMKYKQNDNIFYTDTDSLFTDTPLNSEDVGTEIGLMKDELDGKIINEAYFLGIKQYGYYYFDGDNKIEKSVIAGVPSNSLEFEEIKKLFNESKLEKEILKKGKIPEVGTRIL